MRLLIYSDLHLEFSGFDALRSGYDAVVLAGDIDVGCEGVKWAIDSFADVPVFYVFGNHEFYHCEITETKRQSRELAAGTNVHLLDDDAVAIDDIDFIGGTLWTDFGLGGNTAQNMDEAEYWMNDYRQIRYHDEKLTSGDTQRFHYKTREHLQTSFADDASPRKRIVVTHHAPSARSLTGERITDDIGFAYASELDDWVEKSGASIWIHGHTHESVDYQIGSTRVFSNPRGYSSSRNESGNAKFIADCVVEV